MSDRGPDDSSAKQPAQGAAAGQIPGFEILGKLGSGGMATVFKARQIALDRLVAIKVLPKKLAADAAFVERFKAEGQAAAKLNHANIVQAYDVGEAAGYHYFVMEFVDGDNVQDRLDAGKVFDEKTALSIAVPIAEALAHAHERDLIHRDVKPANIMITRDGTPKLADLGLARAMSDTATAESEKGLAFGSPHYISPEQVLGKTDVDFRADIYGLGATLYHMLAGRPAFDGKTPKAIMAAHVKKDLTPPDHLNNRLSTGISEIIEVMMAKQPADRYSRTQDLVDDLSRVAAGESPVHARSNFDDGVLAGLADIESTGSAVDAPPVMTPLLDEPSLDTAELERLQDQRLYLAIGLGISAVLNVVLLILLLVR